MKLRTLYISILGLTIITTNLFAADNKYVRSKVAKIYSEASFASTPRKQLMQSEPLEVIGQEGNWSKVKSGNIEGWMPSLLISDTKPIPRVSNTSESEDARLQDNARRRASTTTVAGAARGLQSEDNTDENANANYELLKKIENNTYTDEEIQRFMQEGIDKGE